jgi:hypothetical protein
VAADPRFRSVHENVKPVSGMRWNDVGAARMLAAAISFEQDRGFIDVCNSRRSLS